MKWINIEDNNSMPENEEVLVFSTVYGIYLTSYDWERNRWDDEGDESVTHWMPLPKPPKKKKVTK